VAEWAIRGIEPLCNTVISDAGCIRGAQYPCKPYGLRTKRQEDKTIALHAQAADAAPKIPIGQKALHSVILFQLKERFLNMPLLHQVFKVIV
jgi:hypothetical protein